MVLPSPNLLVGVACPSVPHPPPPVQRLPLGSSRDIRAGPYLGPLPGALPSPPTAPRVAPCPPRPCPGMCPCPPQPRGGFPVCVPPPPLELPGVFLASVPPPPPPPGAPLSPPSLCPPPPLLIPLPGGCLVLHPITHGCSHVPARCPLPTMSCPVTPRGLFMSPNAALHPQVGNSSSSSFSFSFLVPSGSPTHPSPPSSLTSWGRQDVA